MRPFRFPEGEEGGEQAPATPPVQTPTPQPVDDSKPPKWFEDWRTDFEAKQAQRSETEDDGILSVEELPDLLEEATGAAGDVVEGVTDAVKETLPEREHGLFRKLWGADK